SALTEPSDAAHAPLKPPSDARWVILPSLPTTLLRRSSSRAIFSLSSMTSLKVSAILPAMPVHSTGKRTAKFPFLKAVNTESRVLSSSRSSAPSGGREPTTRGAGPVIVGGALRGDSCETDDPVPLMAPPPDPADDARRTAPAAATRSGRRGRADALPAGMLRRAPRAVRLRQRGV